MSRETTTRLGVAGTGLLVGLLGLVLVSTCSSAKVAPGQSCIVQSDCPNPLACSYGRCHVACRAARDCGPGQTCVSGPAGQICLLIEESSCALNSMCPLGLFCAQDLTCRSQCEEDRDCPTRTQICVQPDKVCAEPADLSDGHLIVAMGGPGGSAGPGGLGGAGGAVPAAGGAGGGSGGAGGAPDCSLPETAPNDTLDQATSYAVGDAAGGCLENGKDKDDYRFTVPANAAGGYVQLAVTNVGPGAAIRLRIFTASDTAVLFDNPIGTTAQSSFAYFAAAPGATYVAEVSANVFNGPTSYALRATYTAVDDPYEPNDNRLDAKTITVGTPVSAYLFAGYASQTMGAPDDYYKISLADGTVHVGVDVFPTNVGPHLWLYDPNGARVQEDYSGTSGAGLTLPVTTVTAGDYYVRVGSFSSPPKQQGAGIDLPDNFTRPYRLTVTQP